MIVKALPMSAVSPRPDDGYHYFFGYYDKCPWSTDGRTMLAHRVRFIERVPEEQDAVDIGLIHLKGDGLEGEFQAVAQSRAWNWQQGSLAQWVTSGEGAEHLIYNDRRGGRGIAVMATPEGREERILEWPIYTVSRDGRTALSLDFGRLTHLRPEYGWAGEKDPAHDDPAPDSLGIHRIDLAAGTRTMLISIGALAHHKASAMAYLPGLSGSLLAHQHVNHLMFNPSGTRFCFLHRFTRADGILQSRLFTLGTDGSDLRLLMEGMVSHYHWRDDETILAWAGKRALLGGAGAGRGGGPARALMGSARRMLKPVYYALGKPRFLMNRILKDSYLLIHDAEDGASRVFAGGELTCDGHCTYSPDGKWLVTDGYPDMRSRQPLLVWDVAGGRGYEVGRFPTPRHLDGAVRVDLHPRWNRDGTRICFDSAMAGVRRMYVMNACDLVIA